MFIMKRVCLESLKTLQELLKRSYGKGFEMDDELEYFESIKCPYWFYALDNKKQPQGFIRYFPITDKLLTGEVYFTRKSNNVTNVSSLLQHFKENCPILTDNQIRFQVKANDSVVTTAIESIFPNSMQKSYHHFCKKLINSPRTKKIAANPLNNDQLFSAQQILANLKQYSLNHLANMHKDGTLVVYLINQLPVACLHWQPVSADVCEIVTMATSKNYRQQGYGSKVIDQFFDSVSSKFDEVFLKVEVDNLSAIKLYKKCGFHDIKEQTEIWYYV